MEPDQIKNLLSIADFNNFLEFLALECDKLNSLQDLPGSSLSTMADAMEMAIEVRSRFRAYERIKSLLKPFVPIGNVSSGVDPKEYTVL